MKFQQVTSAAAVVSAATYKSHFVVSNTCTETNSTMDVSVVFGKNHHNFPFNFHDVRHSRTRVCVTRLRHTHARAHASKHLRFHKSSDRTTTGADDARRPTPLWHEACNRCLSLYRKMELRFVDEVFRRVTKPSRNCRKNPSGACCCCSCCYCCCYC